MKVNICSVLMLVILLTAATIPVAGLPVVDKFTIKAPRQVEWQHDKNADTQFRKLFSAGADYSWKAVSTETDRAGNTHTRYQQMYTHIPVKDALLILHKVNNTTSCTGSFIRLGETPPAGFNLDLMRESINRKFLPGGSTEITDVPGSGWQWQLDETNHTVRLVYSMNYFPENSLHLSTIIVDGRTISKIAEYHSSCYSDVTGTASTSYHGLQNIECYADSGKFYLKSTLKGQGIFTRDLNNHLNYQHISEFTDDDNYWEAGASPSQNYAVDAHYCAGKYYDFLDDRFGRNSLDNNGFRLTSYLNYGTTMANAFWNGQAVVYGSGNAGTGPLTTMDIAGHEFTHGLIQKTANLAYSGQPGTINEAISDIFGVALEFYSNPQQPNWLIGEQSGTVLRSMSNPGDFNQPGYYHGAHWYYGTGDQGGVHINSGFINKWFYILTNGEQGTDEAGISYHVNGIGLTQSTNLVYHTLTAYLLPNSGFQELYQYTLQGAVDLFGACSPEFNSVMKAWSAVGFGVATMPVHIQTPGPLTYCSGDSLLLQADFLPGATYEWFLEGNLSNTGTASHMYAKVPGNWHVKITLCGEEFISGSVNVSLFPVVTVTAPNIEVCKGIPVVPEVHPAGGYLDIPNPYTGASASYHYFYTDSNGCEISAQGYIKVNELPYVDLLTVSQSVPINESPLLLEANVQGQFAGTGVVGNMFYPANAGMGGPYPLSVIYTDSNNCTASDSAFIEVTAPCVKDESAISIHASDTLMENGKIIIFSANVSREDFRFEWEFPADCRVLGSLDDSICVVSWGATGGAVLLHLLNTCHDAYVKEFHVKMIRHTVPSLSAFPNPANEKVTVAWTGFNEVETEISLRDMAGRSIIKTKSVSGQEQLDVKHLGRGCYFIELRNGSNSIREKLVIQ